MGGYENLRNLLDPLGIFALDRGSFSGEALASLGQQLDQIQLQVELLEREQDLTTAETYGLQQYEMLLPWRPAAETVQQRRAALKALLSITDGWLTRQHMLAALPGCGVDVAVEETESPMKLRVKFPTVRGVPENMEAMAVIIEGILPCHLEVEYQYSYPSWLELEAAVASWDEMEGKFASWDALERMDPV